MGAEPCGREGVLESQVARKEKETRTKKMATLTPTTTTTDRGTGCVGQENTPPGSDTWANSVVSKNGKFSPVKESVGTTDPGDGIRDGIWGGIGNMGVVYGQETSA